jgi:hypothetical protein
MYKLQGNAVGVALRCLGITVRGSGLFESLPRDQAWPERIRRSRSLLSGGQTLSIL